MTGKFSLNLATILPAKLDRKLRAAESAGFHAVGLLLGDMLQAGDAGLMELSLSQLAVSEIVGLSGWADLDRAARDVALRKAELAFELAQRVRGGVVVAFPPPQVYDTVALADRFRQLCRLADESLVRVGLEFTGSAQQINTVEAAWRIVEMAGAANGGLVLDTFHFYQGNSTVEMLEPVPGDRIFLVQLADCLEMPRYELENRHRVHPGSGAIPFEPLLGALYEKGYRGYYSLELYNEDYWQEDPVQVAKDGMRSLRRL